MAELATGLRSPEVARRLGIDGADVYRLLFDGDLDGGPGADGLVYFSEASVEAYLEEHGRSAGQTIGQTNDDEPVRTSTDERAKKGPVTRTNPDDAGRRRTGRAGS